MTGRIKIYIFFIVFFTQLSLLQGQGFQATFGKNKVQYKQFEWYFYRTKLFEVYYYDGGKTLAQYVIANGQKYLDDLETIFDYHVEGRVTLIIYNTFSDFKQSNITLADESYNTGGITPISDNVAFVYFDGNHIHFDTRIKSSIGEVIMNELMYGTSIQERVQNSTLLNLPDWFYNGFISYVSGDWSPIDQEKLNDGILSGHFKKFGRLNPSERVLIGHSLWEYIDKVYGSKTIQNVIYMTHLNKSIESGFTFVLGKSFNEVYKEWFDFNSYNLRSNDKIYEVLPPAIRLPKKSLKGEISNVRLKPSGDQIAYTSNNHGKYKIWIYDLKKKKLHRVFKKGYKKNDRDVDYSYPVIAWHPLKDVLTVIYEKHAQPRFFDYNLKRKRRENKKKLDRVDKVINMNYDNQGRRLVMSALREGKSDILIFEVRSNRYFPITNDVFDDLDPAFVNDSKGIVFSSNRTDDTLSKNLNSSVLPFADNYDIYYYDYLNNNPVLKRVTHTPQSNEFHPAPMDTTWFSFLTDENGVINRNTARIDSIFEYIKVRVIYKDTAKYKNDSFYFPKPLKTLVKLDISRLKDTAIAEIDTMMVYRDTSYIYRTTNYNRNIIDYDIPAQRNKMIEIFREKNKFQIGILNKPENISTSEIIRVPKENMDKKYMSRRMKLDNIETLPDTNHMNIEPLGIEKLINPAAVKDTFKYYFLNDFQLRLPDSLKQKNHGKFTEGKKESKSNANEPSYRRDIFGSSSPYFVSFTPDYLVSQFDNTYLSSPYIPYDNTGPIYPINDVLNFNLKMGLNDLFKDYKLAGGMTLQLNPLGAQYMVMFQNLKRRLDKTLIFYRKGQVQDEGNYRVRNLTYEARLQLKYPFDEYNSLRGEAFGRIDKKITLSSEQPALELPDVTNNWIGYKFEFVHDNTLPLGMNLCQGSRYKVYSENFINADQTNQKLSVIGGDFRYYLKIHRQFIWANRFAFASSYGTSKVVFFLGGVENWIIPKYNSYIQVDPDINYVYKSLASDLRGFNQNIRNGNSYALVNSELRLPIIKYLMNRPLKSAFLENFQVVAFGDIGTAWTGPDPFSQDNGLNKMIIVEGPVKITVTNVGGPVVGGYGVGVRSYLFGYFIKVDRAWGVQAGKVISNVTYLSFGLDF